MPIFTLSKEFEHGGKRYPAGLVEASDAVYMAARGAGVIGSAEEAGLLAPEPQRGEEVKGGTADQRQPDTTTTATESDAKTQTERTVPPATDDAPRRRARADKEG
jgi:hypothetical protein